MCKSYHGNKTLILRIQNDQASLSGARISTLNDDVSWFESGTSFACDQEYIMAALALVHCATSTGPESSLMELVKEIVDNPPGYTGQDGDFIPPITWATTDQAALKRGQGVAGDICSFGY